jgi:hypothetical protein
VDVKGGSLNLKDLLSRVEEHSDENRLVLDLKNSLDSNNVAGHGQPKDIKLWALDHLNAWGEGVIDKRGYVDMPFASNGFLRKEGILDEVYVCPEFLRREQSNRACFNKCT